MEVGRGILGARASGVLSAPTTFTFTSTLTSTSTSTTTTNRIASDCVFSVRVGVDVLVNVVVIGFCWVAAPPR